MAKLFHDISNVLLMLQLKSLWVLLHQKWGKTFSPITNGFSYAWGKNQLVKGFFAKNEMKPKCFLFYGPKRATKNAREPPHYPLPKLNSDFEGLCTYRELSIFPFRGIWRKKQIAERFFLGWAWKKVCVVELGCSDTLMVIGWQNHL